MADRPAAARWRKTQEIGRKSATGAGASAASRARTQAPTYTAKVVAAVSGRHYSVRWTDGPAIVFFSFFLVASSARRCYHWIPQPLAVLAFFAGVSYYRILRFPMSVSACVRAREGRRGEPRPAWLTADAHSHLHWCPGGGPGQTRFRTRAKEPGWADGPRSSGLPRSYRPRTRSHIEQRRGICMLL